MSRLPEVSPDKKSVVSDAELVALQTQEDRALTQRQLRVATSLQSVGLPRNVAGPEARHELAGNMSEKYSQLDNPDMTDEEKVTEARSNVQKFVEGHLGLDVDDLYIMLPQNDFSTPLQTMEVNAQNKSLEQAEKPRTDFVYTYDKETTLGCRPADCPVISGTGINQESGEEIMFMGHFGWQGLNAGYLEEAVEFLVEEQNVDPSSLDIYIAPGVRKESFTYHNDDHPVEGNNPRFNIDKDPETAKNAEAAKNIEDTNKRNLRRRKLLFRDIREGESKQDLTFQIDMFGSARSVLEDYGIADEQIFEDTTDTAIPESGHSSHARATRGGFGEVSTRDLVVAWREKEPETERSILSNPNLPCPPETLKQQAAVEVDYVNFDGEVESGIIEVNQAVVKDVEEFFELALELGFPINEVTPASDGAYEWDDEALMAANASSGFNYRLISSTGKPSLHGKGLAIDVNPFLNPYIGHKDGTATVTPAGAVRDPEKPGTFTDDHPLVQFMVERGWEWGGNWLPESGRTDYHHFQKDIGQDNS